CLCAFVVCRTLCANYSVSLLKSSVILQVIRELQQNNLPLLSFRVDTLTSVNSPKELGRQLELPESPACVLASIANGRECVLIIDQLDAVSEISGRTPHFFECIYAIVNEAQAHRNMRVLLACRKFDLDNDYRFRQLLSEEHAIAQVPISRLSSEKVREVVSQLGVDATRLQIGQIEILSVPLHLKLLAEIIRETDLRQVDFNTVNDLYGAFWEDKQRRIRRRLGNVCQWTDVIDKLCDYMSRQQEQDLFVPLDILDEFQKDAEAMVAEHVLVKDNKKYAFFHHSFFDYAFARRFFSRGYRLMEWLQAGEQHLFRRSQVRQILIYSRGRESQPSQYIKDLQNLLTSQNVRFHIKHIVCALLKELSDPTKEEWEILFALLNTTLRL
ncbi:MAG: hypothetical protein GY801_07715, partial [bacterium]|nr:hypothetical protein [bacterium]